MKNIWPWLKTNYVTAALIGFALIVAVYFVFAGVSRIGTEINEARVLQLEKEKQEALQQRDEAVKSDAFKAGQIAAKDKQIEQLTSQIAESNTKVAKAKNETSQAAKNHQKVISDRPHFVSTDDAGRVNELSTGLQRLYPDSP